MTIVFIIPFVFPSNISSAFENSYRYYFGGYLIAILGGVLEFRIARRKIYNAQRFWVWTYFLIAIIIIMTVRSFLLNEPFINIFRGVIFLSSPIVFSFIGVNNANWPTLFKTFIMYSLIGGAYALIFLFLSGANSRQGIQDLVGYSFIFGRNNVFPAAFFAVGILTLTFPIQTKIGKLAAIFSFLGTMVIYFYYQSRLGLALLGILFFLSIFIIWKERIQKRTAFLTLFIFTSLAIFSFDYLENFQGSQIGSSFQQAQLLTYQRFTLEGDVIQTIVADGRWEEVSRALADFTWSEYLIGRGIAATWIDPVRGYISRTMLHVGYADFVFRGGIILFLVMLSPIIWGGQNLISSKDFLSVASGAYLLLFGIQLFVYGHYSFSLEWILIGLVIGKCIITSELKFS